MLEVFNKILEKIKEYDTIIIHRHERPDGDCIGSQMGLKYVIEDTFPHKKVYAVGDKVPEYLSDLGKSEEISDDIYKEALVITVDTSLKKRICDQRFLNGKYLIKIDHHDDSEPFGDIEYVEVTSPACSSIIVDFIRTFENELNITERTCNALYMGIVTDTGRFRYRSVTARVLNNSGYLLSKGVDIERIYAKLYTKDSSILKLQGAVCNNFKLTPNGVAYMYFSKKLMKKYKVTKEDAANLVNLLDSIKGSLIWVVFVEQMKPKTKEPHPKDEAPENEIRVRIRSRNVAINEVARNYRGGGHLQAAGATIFSKKEMKSLLQELDELHLRYKKENPEAF